MDLGSCPRTHSVKVKNEYEAELARAQADKDDIKVAQLNQLKIDYEQRIFGFVDDCDRRIRTAQRRLEKTPEENNRTTALMREIGELEGAYQAAMADVEQLGSEGKVDESIAQLAKAEALKSEKVEKERELQNLTDTSGASGHQKLRMHLGYLQLRTLMDEWRARGPLPTAPPPQLNGPSHPNNSHGNHHQPESAAPKVEAPAPVAFRPIPAHMSLKHGGGTSTGPPPVAFVASTAPAASVREGSHSGSANGDRERSERDGHRSSGRRDDRREERRDDYRGSSSRYDDRDRERDRDGGHRSSSSRKYDDERGSSRTHSSRHEEGHSSSRHEDEKRSSSRRTYEEGEEREKDKRRRVD
ncbi:hypothetical protein P7C70_g3024, partial [Phenoliferia sp. Uapishka_3]